MKGTDLMLSRLQEYYGLAYSEGMGKVIIQYLDNFDDGFKPFLMAETFKTHSASFKALPDVAVFESVMKLATVAWKEAIGKYKALGMPSINPEELVTDAELDEFASDIKEFVKVERHGQVDDLVGRWKDKVHRARDRRDPYADRD